METNYTQQLLQQLNQQRAKGYLCDVIIVVENSLFRAHKNVLAACSSYFKYLVLHENLITLNTEMVKPSVFNQVLEFIYTGQLPSNCDVGFQGVSDLLRAASYLQLSELAALCHKKLKTCDYSSSITSSSNTNRRLQVDQSFNPQSHKDGPQREDGSEEDVEPNLRGELSRQTRKGSTSSSLQQSSPQSSTSSDELPPKSSSAVRNPVLEQWYLRTDWQTAAQTRPRYSREDGVEGSVLSKGQEGEPADLEWKTSSEVEDQNKVRGEDSALRRELLKCEDGGSEDEEVKGPMNTSYVYQQQQLPWLESDAHESPYMCIPCGKGFPSSEQLMAHVDSHTAEDAEEGRFLKIQDPETLPLDSLKEDPGEDLTSLQYTCSVCGKIYVDPALLHQHERSHRLTRPFSCSVCGKLFTQRGTMTRHMRSHLGLKPFACDECGMRFTRQYRKMEHMRIHSREKPYQCQLCGLKFSHQRSIISHLKMHTMIS
ncbi:hypermethylated in cancer 2 protein [Halichoeres trimaculatus]|uniref:hypermethylated in cancer 2 protein n=1 Tax=Halichoeres trimaculatus TaxID=147232 RepID=UPI003D9F405D